MLEDNCWKFPVMLGPNITGWIGANGLGEAASEDAWRGCFYPLSSTKGKGVSIIERSSAWKQQDLYLDLSRDSALFNGSTIQPKAISTLVGIRF